MPECVSPLAADLIRKMLTLDVRRRATMSDVIAHPWFSQNINIGMNATASGGVALDKSELNRLHLKSLEEVQVDPIVDVASVDNDILFNLKSLGWGDFDELLPQLTSSEPNLVKVFYHLMKKRRQSDEKIFGIRRGKSFTGTAPPNLAGLMLSNPTPSVSSSAPSRLRAQSDAHAQQLRGLSSPRNSDNMSNFSEDEIDLSNMSTNKSRTVPRVGIPVNGYNQTSSTFGSGGSYNLESPISPSPKRSWFNQVFDSKTAPSPISGAGSTSPSRRSSIADSKASPGRRNSDPNTTPPSQNYSKSSLPTGAPVAPSAVDVDYIYSWTSTMAMDSTISLVLKFFNDAKIKHQVQGTVIRGKYEASQGSVRFRVEFICNVADDSHDIVFFCSAGGMCSRTFDYSCTDPIIFKSLLAKISEQVSFS